MRLWQLVFLIIKSNIVHFPMRIIVTSCALSICLLGAYLHYNFNGLYQPTFADYVFAVFSGMEEYVYIPGKPFDFPALWLFICALFLYLPFGHAYDSLYGIGSIFMVQSGNRISWWLAQTLWCVICSLLFFILLLFVLIIFWLADMASGKIYVSTEVFAIANLSASSNAIIVSLWDYLPGLILIVIALNLVQLTLSLAVGPTLSFSFIMATLFLSFFFSLPFFPGNYLMLARAGCFSLTGYTATTSLVFSGSLIIIAFLAGAISFKRMNLLAKETI